MFLDAQNTSSEICATVAATATKRKRLAMGKATPRQTPPAALIVNGMAGTASQPSNIAPPVDEPIPAAKATSRSLPNGATPTVRQPFMKSNDES